MNRTRRAPLSQKPTHFFAVPSAHVSYWTEERQEETINQCAECQYIKAMAPFTNLQAIVICGKHGILELI